MTLPLGSVLGGRYRIRTRLGEGGMGSVYAVEDTRTPGSLYALKILLDDGSLSPEDVAWAAQHFDDEVRMLSRLRHARIPRFIERFDVSGRRCLVMEYIPGQTLEERLQQRHAPLPEADVLRWMEGICEVLTYLHEQRPPIIVRDLKPGNIMITPAGEARLIDFGIARTYKPGQLGNTENLGTAAYASPEHHGRAQTDARSDIYSLGATMYHLLTNSEPTPMETPAPGAMRRLSPSLSPATEEVVRRAMRIDPALRYQSARDLRAALADARARLNTPAPRPGTLPARIPVATRPVPAITASGGQQMASRVAASGQATGARSAAARPAGGLGQRCPRCGAINRPGAKFCARDGAPLTGTARPRPTATSAAAPQVQAAPVTRIVPPPTQTLQTRRIRDLYASGNYTQAVRQAESAVAMASGSVEMYLLLGRARVALGRHAAAADAFAEAARLRPSAEYLRLEGEARYHAGDLTHAQIALARARQLDRQDAEICRLLGLVCLAEGHISQAEGEIRDGLALAPHSAPLLTALGDVAAARQAWEVAKSTYRAALVADPKAADAYLGLGRAHLAEGATREAIRVLEQGRRQTPDAAPLLAALGAAYAHEGKTAKAREALSHAVALDANQTEARDLLTHL